MEYQSQPAPNAPDLLLRVHSFIANARADSPDDEAFNQLALALFAWQFDGVPIYRRLCETRGIGPDSTSHWSQIPALPTSAFKEHAVSSIPESERSRVFHSSGTTGLAASRHFHNMAALSLYEASLLPWFKRHFPCENSTLLFLTPPPAQAVHSSLVYMFDTVKQKFGGPDSVFVGRLEKDGSWTLDFGLIDSIVSNAIADKRPLAVLGTAFSFVHWLDRLAAGKTTLRLPAGSRIMETGGYKGRSRVVAKAELRRLMTKYLAVPQSHLVTEYGMCELSSQAYDGVAGQARAASNFRFPPWARARIVSPETGDATPAGETGLLRIFDLANMYSVMTIQTEDLAVNHGDGFELLGRAESAEPRGCSLMAVT